jgi:hypothetical protein
MDIYLPYLLLVLLVGLGLLLPAFLRQRQEARVRDQLSALAARRGWIYRPHPQAYHAYQVEGQQDETSWEVELYRSERLRFAFTLWSTKNASLIGGTTLFGGHFLEGYASSNLDNETDQKSPSPWMTRLQRSALEQTYLLHLQNQGINLERLAVQKLGSPAFQEKYTVLASSPSIARQVLNDAIERFLLDWPARHPQSNVPLTIANRQGVSVCLVDDRTESQPELLERLVALGLDLAAALKQTEAPSDAE